MKKEMSPALMWGLIAVAVIAIGGLGFTFLNNTTGTSEDPDLVQAQSEIEFGRTPRGENATAPPPQQPQGYSPGRGAEMEARQNSGQ